MSIFKRKDRSPYRHIGMALVPPAAFTAVPDSPPPTPMQKKKNKIIISPIIPAMIGASSTARAVALGSVGNEVDNLNVTLESIRQRESQADFIDEDDMYARISYRQNTPQGHDDFDGRRMETDDEEFSPMSSTNVKMFHEAEVYAIPNKKLSKPQKHEARQENEKPQKHEARQENKKFTTETKKSRGRKSKKNKPHEVVEEPIVASEVTRVPASLVPAFKPHDGDDSPKHDDISRRQDDLEERMQLQNEQTREMILQHYMQNHPSTVASTRKLKEKVTKPTSMEVYDTADDAQPHQVANNELIRDIVEMLRGQSMSGAEGVVLKQQIQELIDENETLKETVHRLNHELSRYQETYGSNSEDLKNALGLPREGTKLKYLTDTKFLSPLFVSYDKQLEMKDEIITNHEQQFQEIGRQMEEILKENEILRISTKQIRAEPFVSQEKWNNVKEQNNLMMEEIQVQMEQIELMEKKVKEMHTRHVEEIAKLSKRLAISDAEYQETEKVRQELKQDLNELKDKYERLQVESGEKVPAQEFVRAVSQCKGDIEDLKEQNIKEMKEAMSKIKESQKEKSEVLMEISEIKAKNQQLQGEVEALKNGRKSLQEENDNLRSDLEDVEKRELEGQLHLANVMRVAERAVSERQTYAAVVEKEQLVSQHALRQTMKEKWEMGRMEESIKHYQIQLASHNKNTNERLREVEDSHTGHLMEYERKMSHLKKLLRQKQEALDEMANNKRQVEKELENVWQAAHSENRRIMDALHRSKVIT